MWSSPSDALAWARRSKSVAFGMRMVLLVVLGSVGLREFSALRIETREQNTRPVRLFFFSCSSTQLGLTPFFSRRRHSSIRDRPCFERYFSFNFNAIYP